MCNSVHNMTNLAKFKRGFCPTFSIRGDSVLPCKNLIGDYVLLVKNIEGDSVPPVKCMKGILSSYANLGKGDPLPNGTLSYTRVEE